MHDVSAACFSDTYAQARHRFLDAAQAVNATLSSHPVEALGEAPLAIDVAILGDPSAPALIVSSGIHGVEGFFGSAVQLALLQQLRTAPCSNNLRWVLIHALNPYGFAHLRRVNEDNVDLNRNFMIDPGGYTGAPVGYAGLDPFLNPPSAPSRLEPFRLKALGYIRRFGLQTLKSAIASGQYEYPRGLFFGGTAPCAGTRIVQAHCDAWAGAAQHCVHIDLHTGLGQFAEPSLLLNEAADGADDTWYARTFGKDALQPLTQPAGTAYPVSGQLGAWLLQYFSGRTYRFVGAEFGTYDVVRVLAALRAENRAHFHSVPGDAAYKRAKSELFECFCPRAAAWRNTALDGALHIIRQAAAGLAQP